MTRTFPLLLFALLVVYQRIILGLVNILIYRECNIMLFSFFITFGGWGKLGIYSPFPIHDEIKVYLKYGVPVNSR